MTNPSCIDTIPIDPQITQIDERRSIQCITEVFETWISHVATREVDTLDVSTMEVHEGLSDLPNASSKDEIIQERGSVILIRCRSMCWISRKHPEDKQTAIEPLPPTPIALLLRRIIRSLAQLPDCNASKRRLTFRSVIRLSKIHFYSPFSH